MKHIKLLLAGSFLFFSQLSVKSQSFFIDSSEYYIHLRPISMTGGFYPFWNKEQIVLDSTGTEGEYYTTTLLNMDSILLEDTFISLSAPLNSTYQLRVKEDKVYFSGFVRKAVTQSSFNSDSMFIENFLLYDFTMQPGDSLHVDIPYLEMDFYFVLDSVVPVLYRDDTLRETFFMRHTSHSNLGNKSKWIKGIGSNLGLNYLPSTYIFMNPLYTELLSLCNYNQLIFMNDFFEKPQFTDYCSDEGIDELVKYFRKNSSLNENKLEQAVSIYPNPTTGKIWIKSVNTAEFEIRDQLGKKLMEGVFENSIEVSELKPGIYHLTIKSNDMIYTAKILKQ
jgi:hypothetical protein